METQTLNEWASHLAQEAAGRLRERLKSELTRAALVAHREAGALATTRMGVRSGRLRQSIRAQVRMGQSDLPELVLSAGGGTGRRAVRYAGAQEEGAVITPRRGRNLAIPLRDALTASGVLKAEFAAAASLRMVPGLFARRVGGRLFLMRRKGAKLEVLFLLTPGPTRIRPKHFLRDALKQAAASLPKRFQDVLTIAAGARNGGTP
jgi:hypothetical protein